MANFCTKCGARLTEGAKFCTECGAAISASRPQDKPAQTPLTGQTEQYRGQQPAAQPEQPRREIDPRQQTPWAPPQMTERRPDQPGQPAGQYFPPQYANYGAQPANAGGYPNASPAPAKKRSPGLTILLLALIVIMIAEFLVAGFKYPGFFVRDGKPLDPETAEKSDRDPDNGKKDEAEFESLFNGGSSAEKPSAGYLADLEKPEYRVPASGMKFGSGPAAVDYQRSDGTGIITSVVYTEKEIASAPAQTAPVSNEEPEVTLGGVTVDFGGFNLENGNDTLTVRELPVKDDEDNGFEIAAWDFELASGQKEFILPVAITLPYGETGDEDPAAVLYAQTFNEELGRWEHVAFDVNEKDGTVTMYVDHFSGKCVAKKKAKKKVKYSIDPETKKRQYSAMTSRLLTLDITPEQIKKAFANSKIKKQIDEGHEEILSAMANDDGYVFFQGGQPGRSALDYAGLGTGAAGQAVSAIDLFRKNPVELVKGFPLGDTLSTAGLFFTTFDMTKDLLKAKKMSDYAWSLFYYVPEIAGTVMIVAGCLTPMTAFGLGALFLGRSVFNGYQDGLFDGWFTSESDDGYVKINTPLDQTYYTTICFSMFWSKSEKKVVTVPINEIDEHMLYTGPAGDELKKAREKYGDPERNPDLVQLGMGKSGSGWAYIMDHIIGFYPEKPEKWMPALENYITQLAKRADDFMREDGEYTYKGTLAKFHDAVWWSEDSVDERCNETRTMDAERFKRRMLQDFASNEFYKKFIERCYRKSEELIKKQVASDIDKSNSRFMYKLRDPAGQPLKLSETAYKDKFVILDAQPETYLLVDPETLVPSPWEVKGDSANLLYCTYVGYINAGAPTRMLVYDRAASFYQDKEPEAVINIPAPTMDSNEVIITLERAEEPPKEELKEQTFRLEVADDRFCDYGYSQHDKKPIPANATLTIKSDGTVLFEAAGINSFLVSEDVGNWNDERVERYYDRTGISCSGEITYTHQNNSGEYTIQTGVLYGVPDITGEKKEEYLTESNGYSSPYSTVTEKRSMTGMQIVGDVEKIDKRNPQESRVCWFDVRYSEPGKPREVNVFFYGDYKSERVDGTGLLGDDPRYERSGGERANEQQYIVFYIVN
ncbi:MAG: zinc-ribbon domain-containing protein [Clostridia bacterium]|nr:zinc-ribbon domain-containing protein [Clostridia bacterium]